MKKYDELLNETFSVCSGKSVLELASFDGHISKFIRKQKPASHYTVEPDTERAVYGPNTFIATANDYYNTTVPTVDVVVCMGLLYHLHSPLHLLEQIINKSKPKVIIIESTHAVEAIIQEENFNTTGNAYSDKDISTPIAWNLNIENSNYGTVLSSVGYNTKQFVPHYDDIQLYDWALSKQNCWMGVYEKN